MAVQHLDSDYLSPELAQLLASARRERERAAASLDRHVNQEGACRKCGLPWPCEVASLTAFTLGAL